MSVEPFSATAPVKALAGSNTQPGVTFTGDTDTGLYSPGANQVAIATGGVQRLLIDENGNITSASPLRHPLGTVDAPTITFTGNTSTGIYSPGTDQVAISTGGFERTRIDSSGRLLVGTSDARATPSVISSFARLQLEGSDNNTSAFSITNTTNGGAGRGPNIRTARIRGTGAVASGDSLGQWSGWGYDGSDFMEGARIDFKIDGTPGANDMPVRLVFSTTADGANSPTERMRITNDGRVLIGHTSTASSATSSSLLTVGSSLITGAGWESYVTNTATRYHAVFSINGTAVGSITTASTSTAYNTSSDYRLKENILPVTDGITRLQQLKPCRFNFIDSPNATVDGFLAHEVQTIVPEAITGEKDAVDDEGNPQYQGIDQSKLVPLLTSALQEAIGRIETLEAEVAALKAS